MGIEPTVTHDRIKLEDGSSITISEAEKTINMIAAGIDRTPNFFGQLLVTFIATARTQGFELARRYNERLDYDKCVRKIEGTNVGYRP